MELAVTVGFGVIDEARRRRRARLVATAAAVLALAGGGAGVVRSGGGASSSTHRPHASAAPASGWHRAVLLPVIRPAHRLAAGSVLPALKRSCVVARPPLGGVRVCTSHSRK